MPKHNACFSFKFASIYLGKHNERDLSLILMYYFIFCKLENKTQIVYLPFQGIKPTKTKNKKGEVADGKKKAKKEPEEKWKW